MGKNKFREDTKYRSVGMHGSCNAVQTRRNDLKYVHLIVGTHGLCALDYQFIIEGRTSRASLQRYQKICY